MQAFRDPRPGLRLHAVRKFTDDAKPQTVPHALRAVSTVKALENLGQFGLAHTLAVVSDRKSKGVHGHGDGRGVGVRQRIVEQVGEHFLDQRRIAEDRRTFYQSDEAECNPRLSAGRMPVLDQPLQQAHELKALVVDPGFGAAGFARLAPVVHQQALAGDANAQSVLQNAGDELAAMVIGVAEALELEAPALCCSGGAISNLNLLRQAMDRSLLEHLPELRHVQPQGDACDGALRLAQTLSS